MMMSVGALALKSLLVAAIALLLLRATRHRSAAERSAIAHAGLLALLALPVATLALPSLDLPLPQAARTLLVPTPAPAGNTGVVSEILPAAAAPAEMPQTSPAPSAPRVDWAPLAFALPAALLLLTTLLALLRLVALRSQAEVLVEPVWLSALAHAQRRMGFKSGTALLISDAVPSPISWGCGRPVILLSRQALASTGEAEAIIAHELAHVISLDWAKLMLARVVTALFWFNPLAWMLAREAHQLREEAADDAVLAAAIPGTDYAQLLVGVARHESRGLLLGAHGVAPSRGSLKRRVGRVLDGTLSRSPARRSWLAGFGAGMLVMAAPLAALTVAPRAELARAEGTLLTRVGKMAGVRVPGSAGGIWATSAAGATVRTRDDGSVLMRQPSGATVMIAARDASGHQAVTMRSSSGATLHYPDATAAGIAQPGVGQRPSLNDTAVDALVEMKATGVTPAYVEAIERAAPWLGPLSADDATEMKAVGVTPDFIRDLAAAGFSEVSKQGLLEARGVGMSGAYARSMAAAGFHGSLRRLVEARAVGLSPADAARQRQFGASASSLGGNIRASAEASGGLAEADAHTETHARARTRTHTETTTDTPDPDDDPDPS